MKNYVGEKVCSAFISFQVGVVVQEGEKEKNMQ